MIDNLGLELKKIADVDLDYSLSKMTTLRIGGLAKYVIYPKNDISLELVLHLLRDQDVPYKVIGKGSNLLCSDAYYDGAIIRLDRYFNDHYFDNDIYIAQAGCSIITLAYDAMKEGYSGLEFASGIPATVGGVVYMNAGAYKKSMSDVLTRVQVYRDGKIEWLSAEECQFGYRTSIFQKHPSWIVTAVEFKLTKNDPDEIRELMESRRERRMSSQPLDKPSAGSVFRNPEEMPAWQLIEGIGYRGMRIGDAMVSEKHVNFIVNAGKASASDFAQLAKDIQDKVFEKYSIELVMEVEKFNWQ